MGMALLLGALRARDERGMLGSYLESCRRASYTLYAMALAFAFATSRLW